MTVEDGEHTPEEWLNLQGRKVMRRVLKSMRWDNQGGYPAYRGNGEWSFASTGLGQVSPDELNTLFEFAGIMPDVIISNGSCSDCLNARELPDGRFVERGYDKPCVSCKRPFHDLFVARFDPESLLRKDGHMATPLEKEAQQLINEGWYQVSRAYYSLARFPTDKTPKQALLEAEENSEFPRPDLQEWVDVMSEANAGDHFLRMHTHKRPELNKTIGRELFDMYRRMGGGTFPQVSLLRGKDRRRGQ